MNRPVTSRRGGPLDIHLKKIGERLGATDDQVLLAWAKAKGAVILTLSPLSSFICLHLLTFKFSGGVLRTSSKKYRLEGYLKAGDFG